MLFWNDLFRFLKKKLRKGILLLQRSLRKFSRPHQSKGSETRNRLTHQTRYKMLLLIWQSLSASFLECNVQTENFPLYSELRNLGSWYLIDWNFWLFSRKTPFLRMYCRLFWSHIDSEKNLYVFEYLIFSKLDPIKPYLSPVLHSFKDTPFTFPNGILREWEYRCHLIIWQKFLKKYNNLSSTLLFGKIRWLLYVFKEFL